MCICMHDLGSPNTAQLNMQVKKSGQHVCIYGYIHCKWSTSAKTHWKAQHTYYSLPEAKIRICFIPLPYFYSLEKYPH